METKKEEFRNEKVWAKLRESGAYRDYLYGFLDGTNNHGHLIASGAEIIYDRRLGGASGAMLIPTIFGLPVEQPVGFNETVIVAFSEAVIKPEKTEFASGSFRIPPKNN